MVQCPHCNNYVYVNFDVDVDVGVDVDVDFGFDFDVDVKPMHKTRTSSDPNSPLGTFSKNREGPFPNKLCPHCGIVKLYTEYHLQNVKGLEKPWRLRHHCKDCERKPHNERSVLWNKNKKAQAEKSYNVWKEIGTLLPSNAITEAQWYEAIKYFNGCAMCKETHVETREFFQPPKDKGMYSVINILPMCGKCSKNYRGAINPFQLYNKFTTFGLALDKITIEKILAYFMTRIEEAVNEYISKQT